MLRPSIDWVIFMSMVLGVHKDEAIACSWFEKAARQGFQKAQHMLGVRLCKRSRLRKRLCSCLCLVITGE